MSGVPERLRGLSECEFYNTAVELRAEVLALVHSSAMPKSQRFTFAVPMAETARGVVRDVCRGQAFYPNTEKNVEARKGYYTMAVAGCEMLMQDCQAFLALARRVGNAGAKASAFTRVVELADSEIALLKAARSGVRLRGKGVK